jgi:hypothetical protein
MILQASNIKGYTGRYTYRQQGAYISLFYLFKIRNRLKCHSGDFIILVDRRMILKFI